MEDEDDKPPTATSATAIIIVIFLFLSSFGYADDAAIMLELSKGLNPAPPGWSGSDPCKWQGVSCGSSGRVTSISLVSKSISGTLPTNFPKLDSLETLSLQRNHLTGTIPALSDMSELREIYLDGNAFSSISSPFLNNLPNLQSFSINDNPVASWSIPEALANSSSLQQFSAANASLSGSIPDVFGSLPSLKDLRLSYNDLTGSLPASLAGTMIQSFWINNQKWGLSGGLDVLSQMTSLTQVWVHANGFTGPIPDLSNCQSLFDLQLRDNKLTGVVPPSITKLPMLVNVSLQNNKLQGPMPAFRNGVNVNLGKSNSFCLPYSGPCDPQVSALLEIVGALGYPSVLADSWNGNDACNNWVHVICDPSKKVSVVNFAKQGWTGLISPAFANLTSLTSIILNNNNLVGTIPDALTSLKSLGKLDLSNNNLTGQVPSFPNTVMVSVYGNPFIGTDVDTAGSLKSHSGATNSGKNKGKSSSSKISSGVVAGIVICALVLLIALGVLVYILIKKRNAKIYGQVDKNNNGNANKVEAGMIMSPMKFPRGSLSEASGMLSNIHTYFDHSNVIPIDVLREVTNNFSEGNILGRGGFGIVYKGVLHDGTQIAVKRMESNLQGTKGMSEFQAEIAVLSKVRHRHLVALLGYCVTASERMVVYEFMPQGTLAQHLFECGQKGYSSLTWTQRLAIALDVARGVEYLHSLAQQSFIHRDLKPSNILLGDNMRAKVSDFGLVKSAPEQGKFSVETRLAGTFGYLAPEYAATGRVTTKVDVFAFGVVLMEIITGRKALDESLPEDQAQLVHWFRRVLISKESIRNALDPLLETDDVEILNSIYKVAELSGHCTAREPQQRPHMSHAVNVLSPLVNLWRPTELDGHDEEEEMDFNISLPEALRRWQAGDTATMSEYSITDSGNYHSSSTATPTMDGRFTNIQG